MMQTRIGLLAAGLIVIGAASQAAAPPTTVPPPPCSVVAAPPSSSAPADTHEGDRSEEEPSQEGPTFEFVLQGEEKCVVPFTHGDALTEEGAIEVAPDTNTLTVTMTGGVGASVFLGLRSEAFQSFRLIQPFDVTCSDPSVRDMILTLDSKLVGFVIGKHKATACVRLASLTVTPVGSATPVLSVSHPLPCVGGARGICNRPVGSQSKDPLPAITSPPLPLGSYIVAADFYLVATAEGFLDAHGTAIFAPEPEALGPWEREHDPFAGDDTEGFGFTSVLTASPVGAPPVVSEKTWKKLKSRLAREKQARRLAANAPEPLTR